MCCTGNTLKKTCQREKEREEEEAPHLTQKKTKYKSVVLSGKQALVYRHPLATRTCAPPFYRPGQDEADIRLRIVRLFVFAKCFFFLLFESISMKAPKTLDHSYAQGALRTHRGQGAYD